MSSRESRAVVRSSSDRRRRSSKFREPPNMSDLRIVLLGKSVSENSRVGNFLLGRAAFDSEAPPDVVERVGGRLKDRHVSVINSSQLLQTHLSLRQITQTVSECVYLCDPGPHVIVLLLRHDQCSAEDQECVEKVLDCFSEQVYQHTMVLTTQEPTETNDILQKIIQKCCNRHFSLQGSSSPDDLLQTFEDIVQMNDGRHLDCAEASQCFTMRQQATERLSGGGKLNLVVCGSDGTLKSSISELILQQKDRRSDLELHGRLISLVELPALIQLSEDKVKRQTLRCVSLCDPGVHVFLLIVPDALLTDGERAEIVKIKKIFDSREHFMVIFTTELTVKEPVTDLSSTDSQRLISLCKGQYRLIGLKEPENSRQIPELLDYIEKMNTEPYSLQMYVKAQENRARSELEEQHKEELKRLENEIKDLQQKIQSECGEFAADDQECLRIVLIGMTGNGKSATGNTILGRNEFVSVLSSDSVTKISMKAVGEVDGRSVAVVDTPSIFDTKLPVEQVAEEIVKCVSLSSPGPHVFVIVLRLGRLIEEEADTMDLIKKIFGHKSAQFSIVLFTRGDELEDESIEDYVKRSKSAELKKLIRDCGNRFLVFNNREKQNRTQVTRLLNMIEEVKHMNQGRYFTNSMFEEAEMSIKMRLEEILKENKKDEFKVIYNRVMEDLLKRFEEEKHRADEEKMKIQNQFRETEEQLRKEIEEKEKAEQKKREIENQKRSEEEKQQRAEYQQKIEEIKREIENQRSQYEKQQKEKEEEDRKKEDKYRKSQEKLKVEHECIIEELQIKQAKENKKRESENQRRNEEEEEERQRWKKRIKEAENDRKEIQEEIKRQLRECEDEKKRQMREREENERKRKERHEEQLREKQEELEKIRKRFEREREEERRKIEDERQKQRSEREEKEREYEERKCEIKRYYERLEREREKEWERRKQEDELREQERKRWRKMIEDQKQEREEDKNRWRKRIEDLIEDQKQKREEEKKRWREMIEDLIEDQKQKREEEKKRWRKRIEDLIEDQKQKREEEKKRRETEEKERKEREEKDKDEMKQKHEEEIKEMKKKQYCGTFQMVLFQVGLMLFVCGTILYYYQSHLTDL